MALPLPPQYLPHGCRSLAATLAGFAVALPLLCEWGVLLSVTFVLKLLRRQFRNLNTRSGSAG
jgi:hypothetical protein